MPIQLMVPDVFWSDMVLGVVALICGLLLRAKNQAGSAIFITLAAATWIGACFHGFVNDTSLPPGKLLWMLTLLTFVTSSLLLVRFAFGRAATPVLVAIFITYTVFAYTVSDEFIWAQYLQALADSCYAAFLLARPKPGPQYKSAVSNFLAFLIIAGFAALAGRLRWTFGLPVDPATTFHFLEMPAIVFLYLSLRAAHTGAKSRLPSPPPN